MLKSFPGLKSSIYAHKVAFLFEIRIFSFTFGYFRLTLINSMLFKNAINATNVYHLTVDLLFGNSQKLPGVISVE